MSSSGKSSYCISKCYTTASMETATAVKYLLLGFFDCQAGDAGLTQREKRVSGRFFGWITGGKWRACGMGHHNSG
jgi:hypothetical protein